MIAVHASTYGKSARVAWQYGSWEKYWFQISRESLRKGIVDSRTACTKAKQCKIRNKLLDMFKIAKKKSGVKNKKKAKSPGK